MLALTVDNPVAFFVGFITAAGLVGTAWGVFRARSNASTIETLDKAVEIRDREIEHLRGQVDVLANGLAEQLAAAMVRHLEARGH